MSARHRPGRGSLRIEEHERVPMKVGAHRGEKDDGNGNSISYLTVVLVVVVLVVAIGSGVAASLAAYYAKQVNDASVPSVDADCPIPDGMDADCAKGIFYPGTETCGFQIVPDETECDNTVCNTEVAAHTCTNGVCGGSCKGTCGTNSTICTALTMLFTQPANTTTCDTNYGCRFSFIGISFPTASATNCGDDAMQDKCLSLLSVNETRSDCLYATMTCTTDTLTCNLFYRCAVPSG